MAEASQRFKKKKNFHTQYITLAIFHVSFILKKRASLKQPVQPGMNTRHESAHLDHMAVGI